MNILSMGTDREILNPLSDVRARMVLYGPLVDEMHIHCITKDSRVSETSEKIAENIWIHPTIARKSTFSAWMRSLFLCSKIIKEKNIDVIVSPDPFAKAWIALFFSIIYRKKFLLSVYGGNIFDPHWKKLSFRNRLYSLLGRVVFTYADAIQTDGIETLDVLVQRYGTKVFWKPMVPANINDLLAISRNNDQLHVKPQLLYIGRMIEQKNIPLLVKVIKELKEDAGFIVVGDGPCASLLPMDHIQYYARQSRDEILERFREADMLILTSHFEGFARVIMEAALAGIPVITTRVSGISGIVTHDVTGYVLEQGDELNFINAVKMLVANQNKRLVMGRAIREVAKANLSVAMMIEKQKVIYEYLAKQK